MRATTAVQPPRGCLKLQFWGIHKGAMNPVKPRRGGSETIQHPLLTWCVICRHAMVLVLVSELIHVPPAPIPKHARTFGSPIPFNPCTEPVRYQNTPVPSVLRYRLIHAPSTDINNGDS